MGTFELKSNMENHQKLNKCPASNKKGQHGKKWKKIKGHGHLFER